MIKGMLNFLKEFFVLFSKVMHLPVYFLGIFLAMPMLYENSYNHYVDKLGELHATNAATILVCFTVLMGLVIVLSVDVILARTSDDKKAKAQDQAQDQTSDKDLSEA